MKNMIRVARLAAGASLLIGLGSYVLLKVGTPIGPFLFAFGLLGVCVLKLNLFTGKCGFLIEDEIKILDLLVILISNLLFGYLIGAMFGLIDGDVAAAAEAKVAGWECSVEFFLKSVLCGVIMYLAVAIYRKGSPLGVTMSFSWTILLCAAGNLVGALAAWYLCGETILKKAS